MKKTPTPAAQRILRLAFAALLPVLPACSAQRPMVKPGLALLEIDLEGGHMVRIRDPRFTAVNQAALPKEPTHVYLSPGQQDVDLRFSFPNDEELGAKIHFIARPSMHYIVKFETFPHSLGRSYSGFHTGGDGRAIFALPFWLTYNVVKQEEYKSEERKMAVDWAQIDVISADPTEGRVARIRVP